MKRFLIADIHFGHEAIIKYENRPFKNVEEMDENIIKNWNNVVGKHDMIFILGDISFHKSDKTLEIVKRLQGRKILILGNHDTKSVGHYLLMGFEQVSKWPIIVDDFYIFSHAPVYLSEAMPYANIHGHLHSKRMSGNYVNVGVECINYTPVNFDDIKARFQPHAK